MSDSPTHEHDLSLAGRRVALVGKLASMSRREAEQLIAHGAGRLSSGRANRADLIVVGDDAADSAAAGRRSGTVRRRHACGAWRTAKSSWCASRNCGPGSAWWTPARASSGCTRRRCWPSCSACRSPRFAIGTGAARCGDARGRRLPYFDFEEVRVARKLAQLLAAGCSLSTVNRKLDELCSAAAGIAAAAGRSGGRRRRPAAVRPARRRIGRAERAAADRFRRR